MENHNFQWVIPLFLCAIVNCYVKLPVGILSKSIPDIGDHKSFIKGPRGGVLKTVHLLAVEDVYGLIGIYTCTH